MKKYSLVLIVIFLITAVSSFQPAIAQQGTKSEQEKEAEIQKAIDLQKKAMAEKKKVVENQKKVIDEQAKLGVITEIDALKQQEEMDNMLKDIQVKVESDGRAGSSVRVYAPRGGRSFGMDDPYVFNGSGGDFAFFGHSASDTERTTWDFSKSVKENTFSKEYTFDVEKPAKSVTMSVNGDCKAGEIRIKIIMPSGKSYSEILIDEFGNLNWRKSFSITETENTDKTGEWKFQVSSVKATGYFRISLQTN